MPPPVWRNTRPHGQRAVLLPGRSAVEIGLDELASPDPFEIVLVEVTNPSASKVMFAC
jgi:hypothetical protein